MTDKNHVDFKPLPFVDESPTIPDQVRIDWIRDGEFPDGAKSITDNKGTLNRAGVKIQQNVVTVNENTKLLKTALEQLTDIVEQHTEILGEGTEGIFERVQEIETKILKLDELKDKDDELELSIQEIQTEIGKITSGVVRTIRDELWFLKSTIGNYPNFDSDGRPKSGEDGKGLKGIVRLNIDNINQHNNRIKKLENDWVSSDVSTLTQQINQIRGEIGPRTSAKIDPIYVRTNKLETDLLEQTGNIENLNTAIGYDTYPYISKLTGDTLINADALIKLLDEQTKLIYNDLLISFEYTDYLRERIGSVDGSEPGTLEYDVKQNTVSNQELREIVGDTDSEGLRKEVIDTRAQSQSTSNRVDTLETNIQTDIITPLSNATKELFLESTGLPTQPQSLVALNRGNDITAVIGDTFEKLGSIRASKHVYDKFIEGDGFASELNPNVHNANTAYSRTMRIVNETPIYEWVNIDSRNLTISPSRFIVSPTTQSVLSVNDSNDIVLGNSESGLVIDSIIRNAVNTANGFKIDSAYVIINENENLAFGNLDKTIKLISNTDDITVNDKTIVHSGNVSDFALTDFGKIDINMQNDKVIKFDNKTAISKIGDILEVGGQFESVNIAKQNTVNVVSDNIVNHNQKTILAYHNASEKYHVGNTNNELVIESKTKISAKLGDINTEVWTNATHDVPMDGRSYVRKNGEWSNATLSDVDGSVISEPIELAGVSFVGFSKDDAISGVPAFGSVTNTNVQGTDLVSINWNNATGSSKFEIALKGVIRPDGNFRLFKREYVDGAGITQQSQYDIRDATTITVGDVTRYQWNTFDIAEIPTASGIQFDFVLTDAFDFSGGIDHAISDSKDYVSRDGSWKRLGDVDIVLTNKSIKNNNDLLIGPKLGETDVILLGNANNQLEIDSIIKTATFIDLKNVRGESVLKDNGTNIVISGVEFSDVPRVAGEVIWGDFNAPDIDNEDYWARKGGSWVKIFNGVDVDSDMIINAPNKYAYNVSGEIKRFAEYIGETHVLFDAESKVQFKGKIAELNLDNNVKIKHENTNIVGVSSTGDVVLGDVSKNLNISADVAKINDDIVLTQNAHEAPLDGGRYVRRNGQWVPAYYYGDVIDMPTDPVDGDLFFEFLN